MAQWKLMGTTALAALISGNAALADVAPEDVWAMWQDLSASYGQTITAEGETRDGDTLLISGLSVAMDGEGVQVDVTIDEVAFRDLGDGSVEVTMSDEYPMTMTVTEAESDAPTEIEIMISHPGLALTVSGAAEEMRIDYSMPELMVALAEVNGVDADKVDLEVDVSLTGVAGSSIMKGTSDKVNSGTFAADTVALNVVAKNTESGGNFSMTGALADLSGSSTNSIVADLDMSDMAAALKAGFATEAALAYGKGDYSFNFAEGEQTMQGVGSAESGNLSIVMNKDRLGYGGGAKGVAITMSGSEIPFPELTISYAESAFNFLMPISKADAPGEFALLTSITDFAVSDEIWGMFDPTAVLPHDPLTLVIDTKGTAKLNVDIMDSDAMASLGEGAPGELNTLDLTALNLKVAGAELTGSGALTFDNSDLVSFDGMPAPTGVIDMKVTGANGLMDKLAQMGLIPEDQLMGARMMLGMFAKVDTTAPDTMTSTLEFKDKGFFANGMQLK